MYDRLDIYYLPYAQVVYKCVTSDVKHAAYQCFDPYRKDTIPLCYRMILFARLNATISPIGEIFINDFTFRKTKCNRKFVRLNETSFLLRGLNYFDN